MDKIDFNLISFCNGSSEALGALYKKHSAELFFIAYKYLRNTEDSEDVVADAFEKMLMMSIKQRKEKFIEYEIDFKALLIVVVKNKSLDKLRVKNNRSRIIGTIKHLIPTTTKNNVWHLFSDERLEFILKLLPEREQQIFKMKLEGFSLEEIANRFDISLKTVSNTMSLSRNKLKKILNDFY